MTGFPTENDVRQILFKVINAYFTDENQKDEMLKLANWKTPPVRHILTELNKIKAEITPEHGDAIKDIFFLWG
jgi:hypothetical protein